MHQELSAELSKFETGQFPSSLRDLRPDSVDKLGLIGFLDVPVENALAALENADFAAMVQGRIGVLEIENSNLLKVVATSQVPKHAVTIANMLGQAFIAENLGGKIKTTETAVAWLNGQTDDLRLKLEQNEQALQQFKEENNLFGVIHRGTTLYHV